MSDLLIKPQKIGGTVQIPPSKSMAHRAVIAASLAEGESIVHNIQLSDDIIATIAGMRTLGAEIREEKKNGDIISLHIEGTNINKAQKDRLIDANESGSTLRFLIPVAALFNGETAFTGRGKLGSRPLDTYRDIFEAQNLYFEKAQTEKLDLKIEGKLEAGTYQMAGDVSSQFITGLLFTLPLLDRDSTIQITTELESIGYVNLTLEVLEEFGIHITYKQEENRFVIPGNQSYQSKEYTVEGDYSQAAFFLCAGALGNQITVSGLNKDSKQGDREIISILERLGAEVDEKENRTIVKAEHLKGGITIDGSQFPDIIPVTALVTALSEGKTKITNLSRLRIKESDRLEATKSELEKLGAKIEVVGDDLHIEGVRKLKGEAEVWSHKDHRMAMMLAIASTVCEEAIILQDKECVAKSYPSFWKEFELLGGQISEWSMG